MLEGFTGNWKKNLKFNGKYESILKTFRGIFRVILENFGEKFWENGKKIAGNLKNVEWI